MRELWLHEGGHVMARVAANVKNPPYHGSQNGPYLSNRWEYPSNIFRVFISNTLAHTVQISSKSKRVNWEALVELTWNDPEGDESNL